MKKAKYQLTGVSPLVQHNGQLSDPLNAFSKAIKAVSGKRKKTDEDLERLAELEWKGSIYLSGGKPCIPGYCFEATLAEAAKKTRQRKAALAAIFVPEDADLVYKGSKDPDKLWEDENFRLRASARVQNNRVIRTRPIFKDWQATFTVEYDELSFNDSDIDALVRIAGESVGLLDWRPRFGRFTAKRL